MCSCSVEAALNLNAATPRTGGLPSRDIRAAFTRAAILAHAPRCRSSNRKVAFIAYRSPYRIWWAIKNYELMIYSILTQIRRTHRFRNLNSGNNANCKLYEYWIFKTKIKKTMTIKQKYSNDMCALSKIIMYWDNFAK